MAKPQRNRISREWLETYCRPRLVDRDFQTLRFIAENRIATTTQIADVLFPSTQVAARRLRLLHSLQCVDRFRPYIGHGNGTAPFHFTLGPAGALLLGDRTWRRDTSLPTTFRHTVAVTDVRIEAWRRGLGFGLIEQRISDGVVADIVFKEQRAAVEVDMGTQTRRVLADKIAQYKRVEGLRWLVFVTKGKQSRVDYVWKLSRGAVFRSVCARWQDLGAALRAIKKAPA